eukprot:m.722223 g.722223  ORF g.722223 m.722223 type:complete len:880 (-) comp23018_c0_seq4:239-2878(-)
MDGTASIMDEASVDAMDAAGIKALFVKFGKPHLGYKDYHSQPYLRRYLLKKVGAIRVQEETDTNSETSSTDSQKSGADSQQHDSRNQDQDLSSQRHQSDVSEADETSQGGGEESLPDTPAVIERNVASADAAAEYYACNGRIPAGQTACAISSERPCGCSSQCPGVWTFPAGGPLRERVKQLSETFADFCGFKIFADRAGAEQWLRDAHIVDASSQENGSENSPQRGHGGDGEPVEGIQVDDNSSTAKGIYNRAKKLVYDNDMGKFRQLLREHPTKLLLKESYHAPCTIPCDLPREKGYMSASSRRGMRSRYNLVHHAAFLNRPDAINVVIDEVEHYTKTLVASAMEQLETCTDSAATGLSTEDKILEYYSELSRDCIIKFLNNTNCCPPESVSVSGDRDKLSNYGCTPLHLTCQYGSLQAAELLVSFSEYIDVEAKNAAGLTALQVLPNPPTTTFMPNGSKERKSRAALEAVLSPRWYAPVYAADDTGMSPATVGPAWSPDVTGGSTLQRTILGMAGPMSHDAAEHFVRNWQHPTTSDRRQFREWRRCDPDRGVVQCGRILASRAHHNWEEYWPFLDRLCDITSAEGLQGIEKRLLENSVVGGQYIGGTTPDLNDIDAFVALADLPTYAWCKNLENNPSTDGDVDALGATLTSLSLDGADLTMDALAGSMDALNVAPVVPCARAQHTATSDNGDFAATREWVKRMRDLLVTENATCNLPPGTSADKRFTVCASMLKRRIRQRQHRAATGTNTALPGASGAARSSSDERNGEDGAESMPWQPTLADSPLSPRGRRARARRDGHPSTPPTTPAHGGDTVQGRCSPLSVCARLGVCGHSSICRSSPVRAATVASPLAAASRDPPALTSLNSSAVPMRLDFH